MLNEHKFRNSDVHGRNCFFFFESMYPSTVHKDLGRIAGNLINGAIRLFPLTYGKFLKINSCRGRSRKMSPSCRPNCFMKKIIGKVFFDMQ